MSSSSSSSPDTSCDQSVAILSSKRRRKEQKMAEQMRKMYHIVEDQFKGDREQKAQLTRDEHNYSARRPSLDQSIRPYPYIIQLPITSITAKMQLKRILRKNEEEERKLEMMRDQPGPSNVRINAVASTSKNYVPVRRPMSATTPLPRIQNPMSMLRPTAILCPMRRLASRASSRNMPKAIPIANLDTGLMPPPRNWPLKAHTSAAVPLINHNKPRYQIPHTIVSQSLIPVDGLPRCCICANAWSPTNPFLYCLNCRGCFHWACVSRPEITEGWECRICMYKRRVLTQQGIS